MIKNLFRKIPVWAKVLAGIFLFLLVFYFALKFWPDRKLSAFKNRQNSSLFYDRNGKLIYVLPLEQGLRREYHPLNDIPLELQQKFIQEEDKNFYHHFGVDFISVFRAMSQNRKNGRIVSGASTITMQLARIIYPRKGTVNMGMKIREMFTAFYLEVRFSKKEILELYLNSVPFGFQTEGVGSAARAFFGRELNLLAPEQIEELSLIPRRPSEYAPEKTYVYPNECPHFVNYVINQYEKNGKHIPDIVQLSINSKLVDLTERNLQLKLDEYKDARIHNGSAIVLDNITGEILVWVGNASFDDDEHSGQIDGVLVPNQPGSSMKPFLYALGLEDKFTPNTILPDIPMDFGGEKVYVPLNFNNRYNGPVRYRVALSSSLNIPAVYILYNESVDSYMQKLYSLGYESLKDTRETTGLSLALGSSEVTLYEMARAFSVFPNDGLLMNTTFLKSSSKAEKNIRCFKSDTCRVICSMLSDDNTRSLGFGHASVFNTPYAAMFKTGTSNQFQNIIALGATPKYTAAVWMGNFEGETVVRQTGSSIPAAIVRMLLDELVKADGSSGKFEEPVHYKKVDICTLSGMCPGDDCPVVTKEYVSVNLLNDFQKEKCDWHYSKNGKVQIHYPAEYEHWKNGRNMAGDVLRNAPLELLYPRNKAQFIYDPSVPVSAQLLTVEVTGGYENTAVLYVDGINAGEASGVFEWHVPLTKGNHTLEIECGDERIQSYYSVK